jgi:hypothetical protein
MMSLNWGIFLKSSGKILNSATAHLIIQIFPSGIHIALLHIMLESKQSEFEEGS